MTPATVDGTGAGRGPDSETGGTATGGSDSETDGTATIGGTATGDSDSETGGTAMTGGTDGATTSGVGVEYRNGAGEFDRLACAMKKQTLRKSRIADRVITNLAILDPRSSIFNPRSSILYEPDFLGRLLITLETTMASSRGSTGLATCM